MHTSRRHTRRSVCANSELATFNINKKLCNIFFSSRLSLQTILFFNCGFKFCEKFDWSASLFWKIFFIISYSTNWIFVIFTFYFQTKFVESLPFGQLRINFIEAAMYRAATFYVHQSVSHISYILYFLEKVILHVFCRVY